ncbi:MAG: hypothetical protein IK990_10395 [Ruminiclostridium sp.]|nr:hypothetical protein [Ruminiclostridium sp.]
MSKEMRIMRAIGDIDDNYIDEAAPVQKSRAIQLNTWTKYAGMAAAAVLVVGIGIFAITRNNIGIDTPAQTTETDTEPVASESTENTEGSEAMDIWCNPYMDYDTLEEAVQAVGFEMSVPESFGAYTDRHIATVSGEIIEVTYYDAAGNEGFCIRKSIGTEDNSGDFNVYETMLPLQSRNGTMSGVSRSDGTVEIYKAVWTDGTYAYSVTAPYDYTDQSDAQTGLTQSEIEEIIKNVK